MQTVTVENTAKLIHTKSIGAVVRGINECSNKAMKHIYTLKLHNERCDMHYSLSLNYIQEI